MATPRKSWDRDDWSPTLIWYGLLFFMFPPHL